MDAILVKRDFDRKSLFNASCLALLVTSMTFAIRASLIGELGKDFLITNAQMGWVLGTAFYGFAISTIIGGPLCDILGMRRLILAAGVLHIIGLVATAVSYEFYTLYFSTLCIGMANGLVEAVCNPLITTIYKDDKTTMLNRFHFFFPGGIVFGGLLAFLFNKLGIGWQIQVLSIAPFALGYLYWFSKLTLPETERVQKGVSFKTMLSSCLNPLFLLMVVCMLVTASTELGTNQWISELLSAAGISGILLLVIINGVMAIGRAFAGSFVHRYSPPGVLLASAIVAAIGLYLLGTLPPEQSLIAAIIFGIGVTYFWPTMLGFVSEYFPNTGSAGLSIMGGAGMLATSFAQPIIGRIYDQNLLSAKESGSSILDAGQQTLKALTLLPLGLVIPFIVILVLYKRSVKPSKA